MKCALIALALALGVLSTIQITDAASFAVGPVDFLDFCKRLDSNGSFGDECKLGGYTKALTLMKSVYKRVNICAKAKDIARGQACFDEGVSSITKMVDKLLKESSDNYDKTKCSDYTYWRLLTQVSVWGHRNMWEKSQDLKQFATVTLPAFKLLGEDQPEATPAEDATAEVAPPTAPTAAPVAPAVVSAAVPMPPTPLKG